VSVPAVDVQPIRVDDPRCRDDLHRFLDNAGAHTFSDGRIRIVCEQTAQAEQVAALLRHLGADAHTIHLGDSK
jgi:hypothetical protein